MTVTLVQSIGLQTGFNVASDSAALPGSVTVGNHLVDMISNWAGTNPTMTDVTDSGSNNHVPAVQTANANNGASIFWVKVATGGTLTISLDPVDSGGNYLSWDVSEFSGLDSVSAIDQTGTNSGTSGAANVTASAVNTTNNGLAIAVAGLTGGDTDINIGDTPPSGGYINITINEDSATIVALSAVYHIYSASETSAATWSHDAVSNWVAVIATFKAAASAAAGRKFQQASVLGV